MVGVVVVMDGLLLEGLLVVGRVGADYTYIEREIGVFY